MRFVRELFPKLLELEEAIIEHVEHFPCIFELWVSDPPHAILDNTSVRFGVNYGINFVNIWQCLIFVYVLWVISSIEWLE